MHGGRDRAILFGLLADIAGDIAIRTDRQGFILHASTGLEKLGFNLQELLIPPHLADLAAPEHVARIREHFARVMAHAPSSLPPSGATVEFMGRGCEGHEQVGTRARRSRIAHARPRWYCLRLTCQANGGAIGLLREIEPRGLGEERFGPMLIDHLTGLANRPAFLAQLEDRLAKAQPAFVVTIEIDQFRALTLRHGPSAGDAILCAFADFLEVMVQPGDLLARLDGERFGILVSEGDGLEVAGWIDEALATFATLSEGLDRDSCQITASAGIAPLAESVDCTLGHAERALVLARASGGSRAELWDGLARFLDGRKSA